MSRQVTAPSSFFIRPGGIVAWFTADPRRLATISVTEIPAFDARGKRHLYGRGDHFIGLPGYHMDVWLAKSARMFVRFWSRGLYVDRRSHEVHGLVLRSQSVSPILDDNEGLIPCVVRDEYDAWVQECVEYPHG